MRIEARRGDPKFGGPAHLPDQRAGCENESMDSHQPASDDQQQMAPPPTRGLGDLAGDFFASLGISEERYKAAKVAMFLDPKCGCADRRKWLNELGAQLGVDHVVAKMARWMDRSRS